GSSSAAPPWRRACHVLRRWTPRSRSSPRCGPRRCRTTSRHSRNTVRRRSSSPSREGMMSAIYHQGSRDLQETFDTTRIADRIEELLVSDEISDHDKAFIESRDMFFLATADDAGLPNCSYKGGEPGFVRVIDEHTVAFPNYDGNGMYLSMGNLRVNAAVGMLFIDFERGHRMRLNGIASVDPNDPLMTHYPEAQFVVR